MPKILVVEDNEVNRDTLSRRLVRKGPEALAAVDGNEGVERARTEPPERQPAAGAAERRRQDLLSKIRELVERCMTV